MKGNWILWGAPLVICIVLIGGNLGKPAASTKGNEQLNTCDLKDGQTGIIRGTVTKTGPMPGNPSYRMSTIMTSQGCEVTINASVWQIGALGTINNKVEFTATQTGEFLGNPQNIQINSQIPDANGNVEPMKSIRVKIGEKPAFAAADREAILTVWISEEGYDKNFVISRELSAQLKVGVFNTLFYDDQSNIVSVEH